MKQKKTNSPVLVTVKEMKTWLDGYCSAHDTKWSPTPEQWKMIKGKIFSLEDTQSVYTQPSAPIGNVVYPTQNNSQAQPRRGMVSEVDYEASLESAGSYGADGAKVLGAERPAFTKGPNGGLKTPDNMSDVPTPSAFL